MLCENVKGDRHKLIRNNRKHKYNVRTLYILIYIAVSFSVCVCASNRECVLGVPCSRVTPLARPAKLAAFQGHWETPKWQAPLYHRMRVLIREFEIYEFTNFHADTNSYFIFPGKLTARQGNSLKPNSEFVIRNYILRDVAAVFSEYIRDTAGIDLC